ncbi:hypothetical protein B0H16DRAFT_1736826 [Mycena metata]|uniref:Uncharacterized protein n=1 Tax=Mycena metata TaxID=1033252 RepID=A0AAD7HMW7_9AGAR|nr:hypothetical protein B0H16DRAFT_1736826 [Mycena metata]
MSSESNANITEATPVDKPNGNAPQLDASIEADLAELSELLSKETLDDAEDASVAELLARLEGADGVAKGVEGKLDALLGKLDTLLEALEKPDPDKTESPAPVPNEKTVDKENKEA